MREEINPNSLRRRPAIAPAKNNKSPQKTRKAFTGSVMEEGKSNLTFSEKGDIIYIEDERRKADKTGLLNIEKRIVVDHR